MTGYTLRLAHSPDSDDLVMWWPLSGLLDPRGRPIEGCDESPVIDTGPFSFSCQAEDVQTLNERAIASALLVERGEVPSAAYDVTAISCHAYPRVRKMYRITASGGSFGQGYGPKVVAREDRAAEVRQMLQGARRSWRVAVPGLDTTAFLTLSLMMGSRPDTPAFEAVPMPFRRVAPAVMSGEADAGLLIHEAQLTFERMGLVAVADLGQWWHQQTGLPLPLGLNVIRRDLDQRFGDGTCAQVSSILSASIRHALEHGELSRRYLLAHAEDRPEWRDQELVDTYLGMYVNELTLDMGEPGLRAILELLGRGYEAGLCPSPGEVDVI